MPQITSPPAVASKRGGKRVGAGRKPVMGEAGTSVTITMPDAAWEKVDAMRGDLSRSAWVFGQVLKADIAGK